MRIEERELMEMALVGYGMEAARIDQQISQVRARLALDGTKPAELFYTGGAGRIKADDSWSGAFRFPEKAASPKLSPEGAARIAAANRKRWAAYRREKARRG